MQRSQSPIYKRKAHHHHSSGLTISELAVSTGAGILIIAAAAVALRSTQTLMERSTSKTTARQNSTNGLRILRSEVERGTNIIIKSDITPSEELRHTDLTNKDYEETLDKCEELAINKSEVFQPVFGISMPERDLKYPVIYGFSLNEKGNGYSLKRCGAPLSTSGRYDETKGLFIANAIDNIGLMGCPSTSKDECEPPMNDDGSVKGLADIAKDFEIFFSYNDCNDEGEQCFSSPVPSFKQPALRIETDKSRKLVKFIDPDSNSNNEKASYLEIISGTRSITKQYLYLAAFSRSNKYIKGNENDGEIDDTTYFRNVTSKNMRFLLDGSGSMSGCILWSGANGESRTYYDPNRGFFDTTEVCSLTRMESLQTELISLLSSLPPDTKIGIESFSAPGKANHKSWGPSNNGLVRVGDPEIFESAIEFINTLDDSEPDKWGGTLPWEGLNSAINDQEADTLYFLSDGIPKQNHNGKRWKDSESSETVEHFIDKNKTRADNDSEPLKINTIALGLKSQWMEDLATQSEGTYLQIDGNSLENATTNQPNQQTQTSGGALVNSPQVQINGGATINQPQMPTVGNSLGGAPTVQ